MGEEDGEDAGGGEHGEAGGQQGGQVSQRGRAQQERLQGRRLTQQV